MIIGLESLSDWQFYFHATGLLYGGWKGLLGEGSIMAFICSRGNRKLLVSCNYGVADFNRNGGDKNLVIC